MLYYTYDGSFEGLLTAVYEAYYSRKAPDFLQSAHQLQLSLVDAVQEIKTDPAKSQRVYDAIQEKISPEALENVYHVYLSEYPEAGTWIYHYLRLGFRLGSRVDSHLTDERVDRVLKTARRVSFERHRFLGLLRFRQLDSGIYYGPIEPDFNITGIMAPHFAHRFADQDWIIHDTRRKIAAVYNRKEWILTETDLAAFPVAGTAEMEFQTLWKAFFDSIAIGSRTNLRLQMQHMPKKYWKYLVEK